MTETLDLEAQEITEFPFYLKPVPEMAHSFDVHFSNHKKIGQIWMEVDGYFVYENTAPGFETQEGLYAIADLLTTMNRKWDVVCGTDPLIGGTPNYQTPKTYSELLQEVVELRQRKQRK